MHNHRISSLPKLTKGNVTFVVKLWKQQKEGFIYLDKLQQLCFCKSDKIVFPTRYIVAVSSSLNATLGKVATLFF